MAFGNPSNPQRPTRLIFGLLLCVACSKQPETSTKETNTAAEKSAAPQPAPAPKGAYPAPTGPRVYVSNEDSDDVSVIDVATDKEVARIKVGKRPRGLKANREGTRLYVAVSGSPKEAPGADPKKLPPADKSADGIAEIDLKTGKLLRTLKGVSDPEVFDLSIDGKEIYVSSEDTGKAAILDLGSGNLVGEVEVGEEPEGVTTSPDGSFVYVASEEKNVIDVVDPKARKSMTKIRVGLRPRAAVFMPDGATAIVTNELSHSLSFVDAKEHRQKFEIKFPMADVRPMGIVLSPDAKHAYVTTGRGKAVLDIDTVQESLTNVIQNVGERPWGLAITGDGKKLYTANGGSHDVSAIELPAGKAIKRIRVGASPWGVAFVDAPAK